MTWVERTYVGHRVARDAVQMRGMYRNVPTAGNRICVAGRGFRPFDALDSDDILQEEEESDVVWVCDGCNIDIVKVDALRYTLCFAFLFHFFY